MVVSIIWLKAESIEPVRLLSSRKRCWISLHSVLVKAGLRFISTTGYYYNILIPLVILNTLLGLRPPSSSGFSSFIRFMRYYSLNNSSFTSRRSRYALLTFVVVFLTIVEGVGGKRWEVSVE